MQIWCIYVSLDVAGAGLQNLMQASEKCSTAFELLVVVLAEIGSL